MYKVFINDRSITLTDDLSDYRSEYDTLFIQYLSDQALFESVDLVVNSDVAKHLCVYADDINSLWKTFTEHYNKIKAAGGVVKLNDKVLMILKNGYWDLPKGKIDENESNEDAAKREVSEECGLNSLSIKDELPVTYHLFHDNDSLVLKETHWFLMSTESDGPLKGDEKEGITDVQWMDASSFKSGSLKSYPSVLEMLKSVS